MPSLKEKIKDTLKLLSQEAWAFIGLTLLSMLVLFNFVNMIPQLDNDFFFSSDDPQFQSEKKITELFVRTDTQLIISASGHIHTEAYMQQINNLSNALKRIDGVTEVKSISHGPKNLQDAIESPLWKRILIADDRNSTNAIVLLDDAKTQHAVKDIEKVVKDFSVPAFQIKISGLPYVVELIGRYLLRDLRVFSILAFVLFGIVVYLVFHSKMILTGMMLSCLNACLWTFMITDLLKIPIGLLTANLATIIFMLTLSHMVFLTYNWKGVCKLDPSESCVPEAIRMTFEASFWSMLTTLLGFLSLLFVPARPLRELGIAGAIGSVMTLLVAYGIYPPFLKLSRPKTSHQQNKKTPPHRFYGFLETNKNYIHVTILLFCLMTLPYLWKIDTDPSMLSFFSKDSEIYKGLKYIDQNGGSSPLVIVVQSNDGSLLNSQAAYDKMWKLQETLENHRSVGSIISLPVLMAQAKEEPLALFLFWDWLLDILEKPQYGEIAKSFITKDRKHGLYLLRMHELNRVQKRLTVVEELEEIVKAHSFIPEITGGVYILQGHLAKLVASSLLSGLGSLILFFIIVGWIVARSTRITCAMILSLMLIPVGILGTIGMCHIPLDVVSSPASNIAIAMGIDSMIHMVKAYRRRKKDNRVTEGDHWQEVRDELWQPVLTSMAVIAIGFSIFLFSTFPPTQRFGAAIIFGTILSAFTALYIMPLLSSSIKIRPAFYKYFKI